MNRLISHDIEAARQHFRDAISLLAGVQKNDDKPAADQVAILAIAIGKAQEGVHLLDDALGESKQKG